MELFVINMTFDCTFAITIVIFNQRRFIGRQSNKDLGERSDPYFTITKWGV